MNRTSFRSMLAIAAVLVVLVGFIGETEAQLGGTMEDYMAEFYMDEMKNSINRKVASTKKVLKDLAHGKLPTSKPREVKTSN